MSFGISGDSAHSQMVGGDVAVAWVDKNTLKGYAVDYYLDAKSQCAGVRGSCPDEVLGGVSTASTYSFPCLNLITGCILSVSCVRQFAVENGKDKHLHQENPRAKGLNLVEGVKTNTGNL